MNLEERQTIALERIAELLKQNLPRQPANYEAILEDFHKFDWGGINAQVELKDKYGVASVIWHKERYIRRSPSNKFGAIIFFSRSIGKDAEGRNQYERLITFRPRSEIKAEAISRQAEEIINEQT